MKIIGANITGSFILNGQDVTTTIQSSSVWSGSVATQINSLNDATASLNAATASLNNYTSSNAMNVVTLFAASASLNASVASLNAATSSLNTSTASFSSSIGSLNVATASFSSSIGSLFDATASLNTATSSLNSSITSLNAATASLNSFTASQTALNGAYATTGSNVFSGTQTITGSLFITNNLVVQGSSSIQNITASAVSIGTNTVVLNTDTPAVRFGGIKVYDSGSTGATGSLLWDSQNDKWIYQNASGSTYSGGMLISGPRNTGSLGEETGLTSGKIAKSLGGDHIGDSIITESGTVISVAGSLSATSLTGSINGSQITDATVSNAKLANSTISGISLGSNLATLTIGTGLSGTSYNGSTGVTIAMTNTSFYIGTTSISLGRSSASQTLNGVSIDGNAATTTALSSGQSNWSGTGILGNVVGLLAWKNYGNSHVIFDASAGTSPSGGGVSTTNSTYAWASSYPTLMGWNGTSTYGVRVDTARYAESAGSAATFPNGDGGFQGVSSGNISFYNNEINAGAQGGTGDLYLAWRRTSSVNIGQKLVMATASGVNQYIRMGLFPNSQTNTGEAWIGRASDRNAGTMTVQLGGNSASSRWFEVVDYAWSVVLFSVSSGGTATASGDVVAYSDARVKANVKPIDSSLEKVLKLTGVTYNRTDLEDKSTKIGFIAQEVEKVVPEVVTYDSEKDRYGVSYGNVTALLVEAIKEQQTQIEELKSIINGLTK